MTFINKLDVQEIQKFFDENYLNILGNIKTYELEFSKILTGWFVKHTVVVNQEFGGQAFLFTDYKVMFVPGGLRTVPTQEARAEAEQKFVQFMTDKFGSEYVEAREAELEAERQKEQELAEIEAKYSATRKKIDGYLQSSYKAETTTEATTQEHVEQTKC